MRRAESMLATRIAMALTAHLPKREIGHVVVVTSALAGEGKSFVSDLLARGLARTLQTRVALIDGTGDNEFGDAEESEGIAGMIRRKAQAEENPVIPASDPRVLRVPAGVGVRTALFHAEGVSRAVSGLQHRFRLSMIDAPVLTDCGALLLHADAVVLVVDSERTDPAAVSHSLAETSINPSRFVGVVLNHAPKRPSAWKRAR